MVEAKSIYTVYIRVIDGTETYIPSIAKLIKEDTYEIVKIESFDIQNDNTSIWEYFPGDEVGCISKSFSDNAEKSLVATRLLNSSFPGRKIYQLVFDIIQNSGYINPCEYGTEIKIIGQTDFEYGKPYPALQKWLKENLKE